MNPFSLLKFYIKNKMNRNDTQTILQDSNLHLPNSIPISSLRQQVELLSSLKYPKFGRIEPHIIRQLLFSNNENILVVLQILNDPIFNLDFFTQNHCQPFIHETNMKNVPNLLWYYSQFIPSQEIIDILSAFNVVGCHVDFIPKAIEYYMINDDPDLDVVAAKFLKEIEKSDSMTLTN
jgi:hypothetical protein